MPITAMASAVSDKTVDPAAARTDFYEAVDGDTIAAMKIPADNELYYRDWRPSRIRSINR
jgi:hypothetical protein